MVRFIAYRLAAAVPLFLALSIVTFLLVHLMPGSAAVFMLGEGASPENIAKLEKQLGLRDPLPEQYGRWITGVARGDFGRSIRSNEPVLGLIAAKIPPTISLTGAALLIAIIIGLLAGTLAGLRLNSSLDRFATVGTSIGISVPEFWAAVLLSIIFAVQLGWFPTIGYTPFGKNPFEWARGLALPSFALGIPSSALIARQMRGSLAQVLQADYIRAVRAAGIPERYVVGKHGLKNALIPVITTIGFQVPVILGGAFVVERVFAIPGLGTLAVNSVISRDIPIIQGVVLLTGLFIILSNLFVDISYSWLNPKVRVS